MINSSRRGTIRSLIGISVSLMGLAVAVIGLTIWGLRTDSIDEAAADSGKLATLLAEQTAFSLQSIDLTLGDVQDRIYTLGPTNSEEYRSRVGVQHLHVWLKERLARLPQADVISITDDTGQVINSTRGWPQPKVNLRDRDYFRHAEANADGKTFVGVPVESRVTGTPTIFFSQRISGPDGRMLGTVMVGVKIAYFKHLYDGISSLSKQSFLFLRRDGVVLVRHPDPRNRTGERIPASSPWHALVREGGGHYRSPGYFDSEARLVAVRPLPNYPLVVNVAVSEAAALERWRRRAMLIGAGAVTVLICFGFLLKALFAQFRELSRSEKSVLEREARLAEKSRELGAANVKLDAALNNMVHGLCMFDSEARLVLFNDRYLSLYGMSPETVKPGTEFVDILRHRRDNGDFNGDPEGYAARLEGAMARGEESSDLMEQRDRVISIVNHPMEGGGWVALHEDITERRRSEERITHMARHDALTDLANRVLFLEKMDEALERLGRSGRGFCVFIFDLDLFKAVNDSLGHPVGDALLKHVAQRLRTLVCDADTIGRLGGDEFAVLQLVGPSPREEAVALAEKMLRTISAPYDLDGHQVVIGISIGIAIAPDDGVESTQLLKNADLALYRAKSEGRKGYRFFDSAMDDQARRRRSLEVDLRNALRREEFVLHYQPVIDVSTGIPCGVEALARWPHPQFGMIPPDQFIPLAEEIGVIDALGEWILLRACTDAAAWPAHVKLAVNLSPVQFRKAGLVEMVRDTLARANLPADRLELEVTESVLLQKSEANIGTLRALKELGVSIVLDDFGTGYSSLSYLRMFPFDKIKIDKSFVRELARADCAAIVCAVTGLARSLNIATTAEGIETVDQLVLIQSAGCNLAQGYLFARPLPLEELDLGVRQLRSGAARVA